ncbi:B3 domain-containing transcription factor [Nymphaea thermarum]|nr:B3 domain-containing transcription factor [Nymphaea thermarum]
MVKNAARKQKYTKYFISRRRPVSREEKRKAFRAAASMGSPFPSFIVITKPTCVYKGFYVNIPVDFLRAHDILGETRTIKVQNVEGREWPVRLLRSGDRGGLESGWSDFVYDNNLEEGDVCAFELINNKKKMLILKVIIFRVVEETTHIQGEFYSLAVGVHGNRARESTIEKCTLWYLLQENSPKSLMLAAMRPTTHSQSPRSTSCRSHDAEKLLSPLIPKAATLHVEVHWNDQPFDLHRLGDLLLAPP